MTTDAISSEYPFDHGLVVRVPAAGPSASQQQHPQAAYEDERYSAAGGMQQSSELVRLEAPPCGFIEGVGIGALYCGGMLYGGERPQGLSGGGMPVLGPVNVSDSSGLGPYGQDAMPHMYSSGDLQVPATQCLVVFDLLQELLVFITIPSSSFLYHKTKSGTRAMKRSSFVG